MREAKEAGFEIELLYIGLSDPLQNIKRVEYRIAQGGHSVPPEKILSRYKRSMDQLSAAVALADYAHIYDNSTDSGHTILLEFENGTLVEQHIASEGMPFWITEHLSLHLK